MTVNSTARRNYNYRGRRRGPPPRRRRPPPRRRPRRRPPPRRRQQQRRQQPRPQRNVPGFTSGTGIEGKANDSSFFDDVVGVLGSGAKAVKALTEILGGMGDYEVSPDPGSLNANSLVAPLAPNNIPFMHSSSQGIRVTHREYLMDVSIGTFASPYTQQLVLNPGDARVFPWLSEMSRNFTQWMPLGMAFEMKSTVLHGVNNVNPQYGTFTMATNYDVYAPNFGNDRVRMLNHYFASSGGPLDNQLHCIECAPEQTTIKPLFIRQDNAFQTDQEDEKVGLVTREVAYDARLYDLGRLEMLGINAPATLTSPYTVGELWITYDILLLKPQISSHAGFTYTSSYNVDPITISLTQRPELDLYVTDITVA